MANQLFGSGVLYEDGGTHRRLRRLMHPLYQVDDAAAEADLAIAVDLLDGAARLPTAPTLLTLTRASMAAITAARFLGLRLDLPTAFRVQRELMELGSGLYASQPSSAPRSRYQLAMHAKSSLIANIVETIPASAPLAGLGLSESEMKDQALTLLFAGTDTTSATLAFAILSAASQSAGLSNTPFARSEKRFKEALVLDPPVYFIPRGASEPLNFGGYQLRKGWVVNVMVNALHAQYLEDGDPQAFIPFGLGPKRCPAEQMVWKMGPLLLHQLCERIAVLHFRGPIVRRYVPGAHPWNSPYVQLAKPMR